jgi:hypothetical protein
MSFSLFGGVVDWFYAPSAKTTIEIKEIKENGQSEEQSTRLLPNNVEIASTIRKNTFKSVHEFPSDIKTEYVNINAKAKEEESEHRAKLFQTNTKKQRVLMKSNRHPSRFVKKWSWEGIQTQQKVQIQRQVQKKKRQTKRLKATTQKFEFREVS